jgi:hypothetical protein
MRIEKPRRVTRSHTQTINGTPADIFPLYCPVKEALWCEGWDPQVVYTDTGVAEPDCVFVTADGESEAVWYVTRQDPARGRVEMIKHTPGMTMVKLRIALEPVSAETTRVTISYSYTSLSPAGDKVLEAFTAECYQTMIAAWETAMNHYLETGTLLTGLPEF